MRTEVKIVNGRIGEPAPRQRGGFLLLEALVALGIFSVAAVAMAVAINTVSQRLSGAHHEARVAAALETRLLDVALAPTLELGEFVEEELDEMGLLWIYRVDEVEILNELGEVLPQMYEIEVVAVLETGVEKREWRMQTLRYGPLYD